MPIRALPDALSTPAVVAEVALGALETLPTPDIIETKVLEAPSAGLSVCPEGIAVATAWRGRRCMGPAAAMSKSNTADTKAEAIIMMVWARDY